jgi:hypothetical protein
MALELAGLLEHEIDKRAVAADCAAEIVVP